jgi:Tfp pilus assembly PilM family ATPase
MSFFGSTQPTLRFGVVIEIGSGSVLVSIVKSDFTKQHPDIIWAKREYATKQKNTDITTSAKGVMTALMNVVLLIEGEGQKVLHQAYPGSKLQSVQVSISAPWSYTITKVINYSEEKPFVITPTVLQKLMEIAEKKVVDELKENELASDLGLSIMTRATTDIQANDYKTTNPIGKTAETLTLTQVSAVAQEYLTTAITDLQNKVLPKADLERYSFMLMFHCITRDIHTQMTEYCLLDLTNEATEIGVVRGGILRYCTHTTSGISTIARKISAALDLPLDEAHAFLREPYHTHVMESVSAVKSTCIAGILDEYRTDITNLLHETGDSLSIPKTILLHGGQQTEAFFATQIEGAAKNATGLTHTVHPVTAELLTKNYSEIERAALEKIAPDTALLVAAQFFHKQHHCNDFIQV